MPLWTVLLVAAGAFGAERSSHDWGPRFEQDLHEAFERLVDAGRWPGFKKRVRLEYLKDHRMGDAELHPEDPDGSSPLVAVHPETRFNPSEVGVVRVGFGVFEIARDPDELAWMLAHELAHLGDRHHRFGLRQYYRFERRFRREH